MKSNMPSTAVVIVRYGNGSTLRTPDTLAERNWNVSGTL